MSSATGRSAAASRPSPPATDVEAGPEPGGTRGGLRWISWLTAAMVVTGAGLLALGGAPVAAELRPVGLLLALLVAFAVTEVLVIHLPTTRTAHSFSLRELPAVLGLVYLEPTGYVLVYLVGAGAGLALWERQRGRKLYFNLALFFLEACLGVTVFGLLAPPDGDVGVGTWLAVLVAVLLTDVVSWLAVSVAILAVEGSLSRTHALRTLAAGLAGALINTSMALLVVVLVAERPAALSLVVVVVVMLAVGYRAYLSVVDGHTRLQALYRFVGSTGTASELDDTLRSVLAEAGELLRAERAELVLLGEGGDPAVLVSLCPRDGLTDRPVPDGELAASWWSGAVAGESVLLPSDVREGRTPDAPRDGIAVPVRSPGFRGVFLVAERSFEKETFDARDLQLFETLGAHAAVTLEKARLVDRLRRVAAEREHDALHDALTGLPNRRAFNEAVARTLGAGVGGAVLLMDLDDFKDVNDTLGHRAGDELLQVTGRRLSALVADDPTGGAGAGTVARLGGDEFAVLLPGVGPDAAVLRARDILASVTAPVPMQDITLTTTASIGVAPIPPDARDSDELLVHADVAMYAAKASGAGVSPYVPEDTDAVHRRLALAGELPTAIEHRGFEVWCQPQTDARTGVVTGVEALLRWWHPSYGWVPPTEVVAIAERTGLLGRLTLAVLAESLRLRSEWARAGYELDISVNVTARDISDLSLPGAVGALLAATGTPPAALVLEITESGVMSDPERSLEVLAALHRLGVGVSVDDFGTGHSSLAYLERLPVNEVKIDQSFVKRLELEATDSTVVRSIVLLAHDLGMRVVAEGVESDVARQRVQALGCELVQGFVVARPMPGDQVPGWVAGRTPEPLRG
ncbi:bifunctional diguanylate cyclase/phosphodiesterase [uncultured Pseudokineococcus sp.]|uniref:putative bifunctional diguanylate cyclase/phosphodiesterase n=1 Tax=uncultured Pseudokineococcus sp. TaxID=1642928 RepID=UPI002604E991|nr:EAL domain-containing protein [uncultured Pseudokineococcus sp.]